MSLIINKNKNMKIQNVIIVFQSNKFVFFFPYFLQKPHFITIIDLM